MIKGNDHQDFTEAVCRGLEYFGDVSIQILDIHILRLTPDTFVRNICGAWWDRKNNNPHRTRVG